MIWIKVYATRGEIVLAACDEDLLGKTFEEGELQIEVSESFYGGEMIKEEQFNESIKQATIVNLVGKKVITMARDLGMIDENCIITIDGVPHAQIARMI